MQIIDISLSTQSVTPVFDAVQYDSVRQCGFNIQEDLSSYTTIDAIFNLKEGETVLSNCQVNDHLVSFFIPINVTRYAGIYTAVIRFISSEGAIHTFPFKVDVAQNPSPDGNVYERAYEDMVNENARAEANNVQMESFLSAFGTLSPTQLASLLTDLQNIWTQFEGQSMTTIGNRLTAMENGLSTAQTDITDLQQAGFAIQGVITDLSNAVNTLTQQMTTVQSAISTLETLANSAVYHD